MECHGAARTTRTFAGDCEHPSALSPNDVTYCGSINENFFTCSQTSHLLEAFGHVGKDRFGKTFLGLEIVSMLDGKPRQDGSTLDIVVIVDVSGSMNDSINGKTKLQHAKDFINRLVLNLWGDDYVSLVEFSTTANVVMPSVCVSSSSDLLPDALAQRSKLV